MSVLVTGGAGYIGSHMVLALLDAGEPIVVLDNLSTGFRWAVPEGVPLIIGDTGDQVLMSRLIREYGVQAIIHFAASLIVPDSVRDPLGYYRNNTVTSRALIESAVKGGVKHFIFSSTCAVYGNPAKIPVSEDSPTLIRYQGLADVILNTKANEPTSPLSCLGATTGGAVRTKATKRPRVKPEELSAPVTCSPGLAASAIRINAS